MKRMDAIKAAIKKAQTRNLTQEDTVSITFKGEVYKMPVIREFEPRRVSVCIKSECNAGSNCCHRVTIDGIELCRDDSERWILRDKRGSWIRQCEGNSDEEYFWEGFNRALYALEAEISL
jgi:hypothetical protein